MPLASNLLSCLAPIHPFHLNGYLLNSPQNSPLRLSMWRCLVVATHRIVMVNLRVCFWLTQFVQAPSHNHPSAMGLAEVQKRIQKRTQKRTKPVDYCNVWCLIDNTFWFGVLMRYGRISGTFSSNGQSSSANSARESRNPPPWSIIPSPTNFTSHHWSYLHLFQLQRNGQWARRNKEKICLKRCRQ